MIVNKYGTLKNGTSTVKKNKKDIKINNNLTHP